MHTKTLNNLHIHINAVNEKGDFSRLRIDCTPASFDLLCQRIFATYEYQILFNSPGFESCF